MNKDLLVEIFVPITEPPGMGKIGTGYPVEKDCILTARHVLFPPNRDPARPIEVRWHYQPAATRNWIEIPDEHVLWPGDEQLDAAVFRCSFLEKAGRWGTLSIESPRPGSWESEGFAEVGQRDEGSRVATAMGGQMHRMAKAAPFFALDLPVGAASDMLHKGASGSPVMSDWKLFGVIVECPPGFDAKRLWAVPSCRLLEIPEFCKAIGYMPQTAVLDLLKMQVMSELSKSPDAMKTLDAALPITDSGLASRQLDEWAKRLINAMLQLTPEQLIPALRKSQNELCLQRKDAAADAIAEVSKAILPAVFDRAVVHKLQSCMFDGTLIDLPVATRTIAEIIMAGAEGRKAHFCKADDGKKSAVATYRIKEPPTAGIDANWESWGRDTEQSLADKYAVDPEDDPFFNDEHRRASVADWLDFEAGEQRTRYVAFQFQTEKDRNNAMAILMRLKERYPALVLLDLGTKGSDIVQQRKLFRSFEAILKTALGLDQ